MAGEGLIGLGQALAGGAAGYVSGLDEQRKYEIEKQDAGIRKQMADIHLGNYQMAKTAFDEKMATQKAGENFFLALSDATEDEGRFASKASDIIAGMKSRGGARSTQSSGGAPVAAAGSSAAKPVGIMTNGKEPKGFSSLDPNEMVNTSNQYLARYGTMRDRLNEYMAKLKEENPQLATQTRLSPHYQDYVNRMGSLINTAEELRGTARIVAHGKSIKGYLRAVKTGDAFAQEKYQAELSQTFGEEFPVVVGKTDEHYEIQPFWEVEENVTDPVSGKTTRQKVRRPMTKEDGKTPTTILVRKEELDAMDPEIDPEKAFEIITKMRGEIEKARIQVGGSERVAAMGAESQAYANTDDLTLRASQQGKPMNTDDESAAYAQAEIDMAKEKAAFLKGRLPSPDSIQGMNPASMATASAAAEAAWNVTQKAIAAETIAKKWGFRKSDGSADDGFYGYVVKTRKPDALPLVNRVEEVLPRSRSSRRGPGAPGAAAPAPAAGLGPNNPTGFPVS